MIKAAVIIPAAGIGKRMQSNTPKTFLEIAGKPVLYHTVKRFLEFPGITHVIIVVNSSGEETVKAMFTEIDFGKVKLSIVSGGKERQDSVRNGISAVREKYIIVHDAVRPFFSSEALQQAMVTIAEKKCDGAILAIPAKDTIKEVDTSGAVQCTPDRKRLWMAQTPQVFTKKVLEQAHKKACDELFYGTDDASLLEHYGYDVRIVQGNEENIKITYPSDLELAEIYSNKKL